MTTATTIRGQFANVTDDSITRLAKRVQLPVDEVRAVIREVRWREAREWLEKYFRPWMNKIHDYKSAQRAVDEMPPDWRTGDDHIDTLASLYATAVLNAYTKRNQEQRERDRQIARALPPRAHARRHELRQAERAARKIMKKRVMTKHGMDKG